MYHAALERCLSLHGYGLYRLVSQSQCPSPGKVHPESATMLSLPSTMCCDMNRFMLRSTKLSHSKSCAPLPHPRQAPARTVLEHRLSTRVTICRHPLLGCVVPSDVHLPVNFSTKMKELFPIHSISLRSYPTPYFPSRQEAVL